MIGDSTGGPVPWRATWKGLAELAGYESLLYSATGGRCGERPRDAVRIFQKSGYAVLRDTWGTTRDFDRTGHLVFKCGFSSTYHRHDDDLSFVLYGYGEDWIIDSGLFRYEPESLRRAYARSNRAHNVVLVDDQVPSRKPADFGASGIEHYTSEVGSATVVAVCGLYKDIRMRRRLDFAAPATVRLTDTVVPSDDRVHTFRMLFHVPSDKQVCVEAGRVDVRSSLSGHRLTITPVKGSFDKMYAVSGRESPVHQGWVSTSLNASCF